MVNEFLFTANLTTFFENPHKKNGLHANTCGRDDEGGDEITQLNHCQDG
jgi:hypothetical protein